MTPRLPPVIAGGWIVENFRSKKGKNPRKSRVYPKRLWKSKWKMCKVVGENFALCIVRAHFSTAQVNKPCGKVENPVENLKTFPFSTKLLTNRAVFRIFIV